MKNRNLALILALAIYCPFVSNAEVTNPQDRNMSSEEDTARARMGDNKDNARLHKMVDQSAVAYAAIAKGPHGQVPAAILKNARCIAVLPSVMTGAIVIGGSHGEGLASCKDAKGTWSLPAPVSINQGSIGLQAGAKSADLVLFIQSKEAVQAIKSGNITFGTDVSAVAGTYDSSVDTSAAGVVAYTRSEGLFAGAAVNGGKMAKDQDEIARYYGRKIDYTALLEGRESTAGFEYTQNLTKLFP